MRNSIEFAVQLKAIRTERNTTQQELADYLRLTKATISAYEIGIRFPTIGVIKKICRYFNIPIDYFIGGVSEPVLDVTGLTKSQIEIISNIINEMRRLNQK